MAILKRFSAVITLVLMSALSCSKGTDPSTSATTYNGTWTVDYSFFDTNQNGQPECTVTYTGAGVITLSNGEFTNNISYIPTDVPKTPAACTSICNNNATCCQHCSTVGVGNSFPMYIYGTIDSKGGLVGYMSFFRYFDASPIISFNATASSTVLIKATGNRNLSMTWKK
jgi:hypothetical protein